MFASSSLTEEGVEAVITSTNGLIRWHLSVRLNAMFQAVQLPTGIADLNSSLSNMDRDTLTLKQYITSHISMFNETMVKVSKFKVLLQKGRENFSVRQAKVNHHFHGH
jgi:hypothetical protein